VSFVRGNALRQRSRQRRQSFCLRRQRWWCKNAPSLSSNANRWRAHERTTSPAIKLSGSQAPSSRSGWIDLLKSISTAGGRGRRAASQLWRQATGGRRVRHVHGRRAQVWSSEPAAVARRDGGSMELRLRRRSPPALSLSLSLLAAPWRPRHWRMASLGAHGAHTPLGVSSDSGVGRRGHEAEEETAGGLLLVASKSYLP
jgi:hypothetical protein